MAITKNCGIKLYLLSDMEEFDVENKFVTISKKNCKPLEKCMKVITDEDLSYAKMIIDKYLGKIL